MEDKKTCNCPNCGASNVKEVSDGEYHCQFCGSDFIIKKKNIVNNINVTNVYTTNGEDIKEYACPAKITEKQFIKNIVDSLSNKMIPIDFFEAARISTVKKEYTKKYFINDNVTVSYTSQLKIKRVEHYTEYETAKDSNGNTYQKPVTKERVYYDYLPNNGIMNYPVIAIAGANSEHYVKEKMVECDKFEFDAPVRTDSLEASYKDAVYDAQSYAENECYHDVRAHSSYDQQVVDFRASSTSNVTSKSIVAIPTYSLEYEYNGQKGNFFGYAVNEYFSGSAPLVDSYDSSKQKKLEADLAKANDEYNKVEKKANKLNFMKFIAMPCGFLGFFGLIALAGDRDNKTLMLIAIALLALAITFIIIPFVWKNANKPELNKKKEELDNINTEISNFENYWSNLRKEKAREYLSSLGIE